MDLPTFVTFMVMFMLLFFGILVIFLTYRHHRHVIDLNHQERMNALERGLELPALPSEGEGALREAPAGHFLHRGLIFTLLGLSLMVALGVNVGVKSALWGLPVSAFGIAYLILWVVAARKQRRA